MQGRQFPMVLCVIDTKLSREPEGIRAAWSVQEFRVDSRNATELLVFPHLCATYPVTSKQQRTKHQSVSDVHMA